MIRIILCELSGLIAIGLILCIVFSRASFLEKKSWKYLAVSILSIPHFYCIYFLSTSVNSWVMSEWNSIRIIVEILFIVSFILFIWIIVSKKHKRSMFFYSISTVFYAFCMYGIVLIPSGALGVDIISYSEVGIYNATVLRAADSKNLVEWLNRNHFAFTKEDEVAFDSYISKGWCFVVAKLNPEKADVLRNEQKQFWFEGLADPLILRFASETPIYPLALTATGGRDTEVLIYLLTQQKMECGKRLELKYAGEAKDFNLHEMLGDDVEPKGFFGSEDSKATYLCKFKGTMTPEQMKEDLVFTPAPDNKPYREREIKW